MGAYVFGAILIAAIGLGLLLLIGDWLMDGIAELFDDAGDWGDE